MTTEELQQIMGEAQHDILNAYIASRSPNPGLSELGEPLTPDPKTTVEITRRAGFHDAHFHARHRHIHALKRIPTADGARRLAQVGHLP